MPVLHRARAGLLTVLTAAAVGATAPTPPTATAATPPAATAPHAPRIATTAALAHTVERDLAAAHGQTSALVLDATTGRTLVAQDATAPRVPASVEKLFTTAAALFQFGPTHRFTTSLQAIGTRTGDRFDGTLYLKGGGDPTFGDAAFDQAAYTTGATMQTLLGHLSRQTGITRIAGRIEGDASVFDSLGGGPDTGYRASLETEGELSGLSYDAGFTTPRETALAPNPALAAVQALVHTAPHQHIAVAPHTVLGTATTPADAATVASVTSPPLTTLLQLTNAPSDNFFAETLLKDLSVAPGHPGSTAAGAAIVAGLVAQRLGLSERLDDGSGLSRHDRTTAQVVVDLLAEMAPSRPFVQSLAIAGRTGTLEHEMVGTPAANNCRGKTGTLTDVANLAGYCTAADGHQLVFAFLQNSLRDADLGHRTEADAAVALAEYAGDGQGTPFPALPRPNAGAATNP